MGKVRVTQVRRGKKITFLTKDKGKPGKTPKSEQWFEPGVETGWQKDMPIEERRRLVLRAHKGDELASARAMQALSNVSTDRETVTKAGEDARYFFHKHRIATKPSLRRSKTPRITPPRPKLRR